MDVRSRLDAAWQQAASFVHQHPWAVCSGLVGLPIAYKAVISLTKPRLPPSDFNSFLVKPSKRNAPVAAPRDARSFSAFLKNQPPAKDPTSFSSFLKASGPDPGSALAPAGCAATTDAPEAPQLSGEHVVVTILFGTEYGFTKEIAEKLRDQLRDMPPFWPKMVDMADHSEGLDLSKEQAVLMMCSTQGEGVPPAEARDFCEWFASDAAPRLEAVKFSVLALGDKSYTYFCATGKQLDGRAGELGGQRIADRVDVNREDWKAVDAWIAAVVAALPSLGLKTVAETGGVPTTAEPVAAKPKRWNKARPFYARVVALEGLCHIRKASDKDTIRVELDLGESGLQYIPGDALGILPYNCPQAVDDLVAQMGAEGGSLVAPPSWHYEESLELSGARQGDKLTLRDALCRCYDLRCPKPDLLRVLLDHLPPSARQPIKNGKTNGKLHIITSAKTPGAASNASVHSRSSSSVEAAEANGHRQSGQADSNGHSPSVQAESNGNHDSSRAQANGNSHAEANATVPAKAEANGNGNSHVMANGNGYAEANGNSHVSSHSNRTAVGLEGFENSSSLSNGTQHAGSNGVARRHTVPPLPVAKQAAKLQQLISSESAEAYLEERHVIDVLQDFAASMPPLDKVLACLRPLLPRLYSISSSMLEGPRQVQVTVAVVRYVSLGVERVGVTSTQLAERLQVGDLVPVYMHKNPDFRLPSDPATPIIMVGPGTGLAPFRSFMQERIIASQASGTSYGESVLFFGCRRRDQDFLYGEQLECWAAQGKLTLFTAFSREQGHKVYVQDQIRQQRGLVWRLLEEGAHFYVCGDAAHMAGSVETALLDIIAERKGSAAAANAYLDALRAQQRYQRDVWY